MRETSQSLPKTERLSSKILWGEVVRKGTTFFQFPVKAWICPIGDQLNLQVAFVAPKKRFRKAVARNRQKRLLREAYRLSPHRPACHIHYAMVFLSVAPEDVSFSTVQKGMDKLLLQFKNQMNDHHGN
ncbi:MAG: ribonuclease P protein component [Cryomorphaceae bacterium]|nr:ribonuclease P protein component [Cryomorphaceae bacterium]